MVIAVQILLLIFMISISTTLTQVNLVNGASDKNSAGDGDGKSVKNKDVFALLKLEKDVAKAEGSLKELHSGKKNPFELLGEIKNDGKFKPESGSFLPEYDDKSKENNN